MPLTPEYRAYIGELFVSIGPIGLKRAFGLDAMITEGVMVGFLIDGTIYLRTDR